MDAKIRNAIKRAEEEPTAQNKQAVWDLFKRYNIRFCGCESRRCPVCLGEMCFYPADKNTFIDLLGAICTGCARYTPLEYHGAVDRGRDLYFSCECEWCLSMLEWAEKVLLTNKRDAEVVATEVIPTGHPDRPDTIRLHLWEDGRMTHAFLPLYIWPRYDEYHKIQQSHLGRYGR